MVDDAADLLHPDKDLIVVIVHQGFAGDGRDRIDGGFQLRVLLHQVVVQVADAFGQGFFHPAADARQGGALAENGGTQVGGIFAGGVV